MRLILIQQSKGHASGGRQKLLRFAISSQPIASIILEGLSTSLGRNEGGHTLRLFAKSGRSKTIWAIPKGWNSDTGTTGPETISYVTDVPICLELLRRAKRDRWFIISNGRFAAQPNSELLNKVLASCSADIIGVNVRPELLAYREKVVLTSDGKLVGFRRFHSDSAEPAPFPDDWPHYTFVKNTVVEDILGYCGLPADFSTLVERCRSNTLTLRSFDIAGLALDLETEDGLLDFCRARLGYSSLRCSNGELVDGKKGPITARCEDVCQDARFSGKVLLGNNVHIGEKVIIVGPTIIGDDVRIGQGAAINSSIIGPGVHVPRNQCLQNRIVKGRRCNWKRPARSVTNNSKRICFPNFDLSPEKRAVHSYRVWPRLSYARCFKRIADCLFAIIVLILFAPVMPFIALAIKLTSPGPVFYKDKRQGLHGKEFSCLKFRSMTSGADKIQDKLRTHSEVDGPQFKIEDDPRISAVGRFLRDTYIDEIPQFFNVLLGQMSVIGPRPSPEGENTMCPPWRDARLSVRPGITGLWQICRTRRPLKDFQEWISYDIKYVRDLSLKLDLWICWQTVKKLVKNFIGQF